MRSVIQFTKSIMTNYKDKYANYSRWKSFSHFFTYEFSFLWLNFILEFHSWHSTLISSLKILILLCGEAWGLMMAAMSTQRVWERPRLARVWQIYLLEEHKWEADFFQSQVSLFIKIRPCLILLFHFLSYKQRQIFKFQPSFGVQRLFNFDIQDG